MKKIFLIISFFFSFNTYSEVRIVYRESTNSSIVAACGFPIGTKYSVDKTKACTGSKSGYTWTWFSATVGSIDVGWRNSTGKTGSARSISRSSTCDAPSQINPDTGKCEEPKCKAGENTGVRSWPWSSHGSAPSLCLQQCSYNLDDVSVCLISTDKCLGSFVSTTSSCSDNGLTSGGGYPKPPPGDCIWTGPEDDRVLECNGDGDGDGQPDPDVPKDPDAECSWDGDTLVCNGGTYPPDTGGGEGGDGGGSGGSGGDNGVDPIPPAPDLTGVIKAVRDFNSDNNANLQRLNDTNSKGFDKVVSTNTTGLDKVVDTNTTGFGDVVTAINGIQTGGSTVDLSKIEGSLTGIENGINSITGTDTSGANFTDCYSTDSCASLYETEYPQYENISEMVSEKMDAISNGIIKQVVDTFITIDISNAQKPDTNACFDFGFFNFGCFDFFEDLSYIWAFIRVCLIFTAIMTARKLVFGG